MNKKFYITTPIFYPNANLHMGHAYTTTLCDILARYHRNLGQEVYFLTGADENTQKVVRAAKTARKETSDYLNEITSNFKKLFKELNISYDQFIRTSDEKEHWPGVSEMWNRLEKNGDIEKRKYSGLYCVGHEAFITEKELVDGKCPEHGEAPEEISEENYFFLLSKYTNEVKEKIINDEFEILPKSRKNEILALFDRGLEDVSFSRPADKMSVGIPVPNDPSQKIYVWCDALTNYISALGFGRDEKLYKKFWPADLQVVGKDILRFHAAIWPAMLLSANLPLPKKLLVHGFITSGGQKMSKTLGNVVDPEELIKEYGSEAVRYYLARYVSPFEDSDLTKERFRAVYNADLANGLGNLVSRVMKMAENNDIKLSDFKRTDSPEIKDFFEKFDLKRVADVIWNKVMYLDSYIQNKEPFKKIKENFNEAKEDILFLLNELRNIAEDLSPFMPDTSKKIIDLISSNKSPSTPLFARKE